jgi:hypothetical protein
MRTFSPQRDYLERRACQRSNEITGHSLRIQPTAEERRRLAARREIENRRIEREALQ